MTETERLLIEAISNIYDALKEVVAGLEWPASEHVGYWVNDIKADVDKLLDLEGGE